MERDEGRRARTRQTDQSAPGLAQPPDPPQQAFRLFRVNGKPILIRGGGYTPDMILREDPEKLRAQFRMVRDMGLNTIRSEGKMEPEEFFNLADEQGVLVIIGWSAATGGSGGRNGRTRTSR